MITLLPVCIPFYFVILAMRISLWLFGTLLLFSCKNPEPSKENIPEDTIESEVDVSPYSKLIWITDYDTVKNEFYLKKQRTVYADTLTAENVINNINAAWENVQLVFLKVSNDTLYVSIPESDYLTEQMGSAGSEAYMASTTYSLTELKGINFVNYDFEEGDHVSPGTYSRKDYEDFR